MVLEDLTYKVRAAIFTVFKELGPGLLESVYEAALAYELKSIGLQVLTQVGVPVYYRGQLLDLGFRMDILVEGQVILEIKSIETLHDVHKKQLLTYLRLADKRVGLLVNFNVNVLEDRVSLIRIVN
jgi:GxxExxY protein